MIAGMTNERQHCRVIEDGVPCSEWAVKGRDVCIRHGGLRAGEGGLAATPGELLDELVVMLVEKQAQFHAMLDRGDLPSEQAMRLFGLLSLNAARVGRLLRDQRALSGEAADGIASAISQALNELSIEMGNEL